MPSVNILVPVPEPMDVMTEVVELLALLVPDPEKFRPRMLKFCCSSVARFVAEFAVSVTVVVLPGMAPVLAVPAASSVKFVPLLTPLVVFQLRPLMPVQKAVAGVVGAVPGVVMVNDMTVDVAVTARWYDVPPDGCIGIQHGISPDHDALAAPVAVI